MLASRSVVHFLAIASSMVTLAWGCASGETDPVESGSANGGDGPAVGGSTNIGPGGGGVGGVGASPCSADCSQIDTPDCYEAVCNDGAHPGPVGDCVVVAEATGAPCDDGAFCTVNDACDAGVCVGGPPNDCGMFAEPCQQITCDEAGDVCNSEAAVDGRACTSGDLCVVNATCQGGVCSGGTANDCLFAPVPDDCHFAVCNPLTGNCEPLIGNDGLPCTDQNDLCTEGKTCLAGQCIGGAPKDCSQLSVDCNVGVCDTVTGTCTTMGVGDGQPCNDLDACTTGETCSSGSCGMGSAVMTCSSTPDGCCPANCTAANDYECDCPGTYVNNVCVYLANPSASYLFASAQAQCQGMGAGWDLCSPSMLCQSAVYSYLSTSGCDCTGGAAACSCGSAANVYVHVTGGTSPYYIRQPEIANCGATACTNSVSETCGAALCCRN